MQARMTLPAWDSLAELDDEALPLLPTALLIARDEYPDLDPQVYDALVQSHADHLRTEVDTIEHWPLKIAAVNRHLFDELGYGGDHGEYYDPRNSYLWAFPWTVCPSPAISWCGCRSTTACW
jgi:regulator of sirC expression with transglutaminase-like and TPR domain